MLLDITLPITPQLAQQHSTKKDLAGHLGTHFDVMDKEFPLEYTRLAGIVFDVSDVTDREIDLCDVEMNKIQAGSFVAFYSGYIEREGYGSPRYFTEHPQLSYALIRALTEKRYRSSDWISVGYVEVQSTRRQIGIVLTAVFL